jgi:hypothetical protein
MNGQTKMSVAMVILHNIYNKADAELCGKSKGFEIWMKHPEIRNPKSIVEHLGNSYPCRSKGDQE